MNKMDEQLPQLLVIDISRLVDQLTWCQHRQLFREIPRVTLAKVTELDYDRRTAYVYDFAEDEEIPTFKTFKRILCNNDPRVQSILINENESDERDETSEDIIYSSGDEMSGAEQKRRGRPRKVRSSVSVDEIIEQVAKDIHLSEADTRKQPSESQTAISEASSAGHAAVPSAAKIRRQSLASRDVQRRASHDSTPRTNREQAVLTNIDNKRKSTDSTDIPPVKKLAQSFETADADVDRMVLSTSLLSNKPNMVNDTGQCFPNNATANYYIGSAQNEPCSKNTVLTLTSDSVKNVSVKSSGSQKSSTVISVNDDKDKRAHELASSKLSNKPTNQSVDNQFFEKTQANPPAKIGSTNKVPDTKKIHSKEILKHDAKPEDIGSDRKKPLKTSSEISTNSHRKCSNTKTPTLIPEMVKTTVIFDASSTHSKESSIVNSVSTSEVKARSRSTDSVPHKVRSSFNNVPTKSVPTKSVPTKTVPTITDKQLTTGAVLNFDKKTKPGVETSQRRKESSSISEILSEKLVKSKDRMGTHSDHTAHSSAKKRLNTETSSIVDSRTAHVTARASENNALASRKSTDSHSKSVRHKKSASSSKSSASDKREEPLSKDRPKSITEKPKNAQCKETVVCRTPNATVTSSALDRRSSGEDSDPHVTNEEWLERLAAYANGLYDEKDTTRDMQSEKSQELSSKGQNTKEPHAQRSVSDVVKKVRSLVPPSSAPPTCHSSRGVTTCHRDTHHKSHHSSSSKKPSKTTNADTSTPNAHRKVIYTLKKKQGSHSSLVQEEPDAYLLNVLTDDRQVVYRRRSSPGKTIPSDETIASAVPVPTKPTESTVAPVPVTSTLAEKIALIIAAKSRSAEVSQGRVTTRDVETIISQNARTAKEIEEIFNQYSVPNAGVIASLLATDTRGAMVIVKPATMAASVAKNPVSAVTRNHEAIGKPISIVTRNAEEANTSRPIDNHEHLSVNNAKSASNQVVQAINISEAIDHVGALAPQISLLAAALTRTENSADEVPGTQPSSYDRRRNESASNHHRASLECQPRDVSGQKSQLDADVVTRLSAILTNGVCSSSIATVTSTQEQISPSAYFDADYATYSARTSDVGDSPGSLQALHQDADFANLPTVEDSDSAQTAGVEGHCVEEEGLSSEGQENLAVPEATVVMEVSTSLKKAARQEPRAPIVPPRVPKGLTSIPVDGMKPVLAERTDSIVNRTSPKGDADRSAVHKEPALIYPVLVTKKPVTVLKEPALVLKGRAPVKNEPALDPKGPAPVLNEPACFLKGPVPIHQRPSPVLKRTATVLKEPVPFLNGPAAVRNASKPLRKEAKSVLKKPKVMASDDADVQIVACEKILKKDDGIPLIDLTNDDSNDYVAMMNELEFDLSNESKSFDATLPGIITIKSDESNDEGDECSSRSPLMSVDVRTVGGSCVDRAETEAGGDAMDQVKHSTDKTNGAGTPLDEFDSACDNDLSALANAIRESQNRQNLPSESEDDPVGNAETFREANSDSERSPATDAVGQLLVERPSRSRSSPPENFIRIAHDLNFGETVHLRTHGATANNPPTPKEFGNSAPEESRAQTITTLEPPPSPSPHEDSHASRETSPQDVDKTDGDVKPPVRFSWSAEFDAQVTEIDEDDVAVGRDYDVTDDMLRDVIPRLQTIELPSDTNVPVSQATNGTSSSKGDSSFISIVALDSYCKLSNIIVKCSQIWYHLVDSDPRRSQYEEDVQDFKGVIDSHKLEVARMVQILLSNLGHRRLHDMIFACVKSQLNTDFGKRIQGWVAYTVFYHFLDAMLLFVATVPTPSNEHTVFMEYLTKMYKKCVHAHRLHENYVLNSKHATERDRSECKSEGQQEEPTEPFVGDSVHQESRDWPSTSQSQRPDSLPIAEPMKACDRRQTSPPLDLSVPATPCVALDDRSRTKASADEGIPPPPQMQMFDDRWPRASPAQRPATPIQEPATRISPLIMPVRTSTAPEPLRAQDVSKKTSEQSQQTDPVQTSPGLELQRARLEDRTSALDSRSASITTTATRNSMPSEEKSLETMEQRNAFNQHTVGDLRTQNDADNYSSQQSSIEMQDVPRQAPATDPPEEHQRSQSLVELDPAFGLHFSHRHGQQQSSQQSRLTTNIPPAQQMPPGFVTEQFYQAQYIRDRLNAEHNLLQPATAKAHFQQMITQQPSPQDNRPPVAPPDDWDQPFQSENIRQTTVPLNTRNEGRASVLRSYRRRHHQTLGNLFKDNPAPVDQPLMQTSTHPNDQHSAVSAVEQKKRTRKRRTKRTSPAHESEQAKQSSNCQQQLNNQNHQMHPSMEPNVQLYPNQSHRVHSSADLNIWCMPPCPSYFNHTGDHSPSRSEYFAGQCQQNMSNSPSLNGGSIHQHQKYQANVQGNLYIGPHQTQLQQQNFAANPNVATIPSHLQQQQHQANIQTHPNIGPHPPQLRQKNFIAILNVATIPQDLQQQQKHQANIQNNPNIGLNEPQLQQQNFIVNPNIATIPSHLQQHQIFPTHPEIRSLLRPQESNLHAKSNLVSTQPQNYQNLCANPNLGTIQPQQQLNLNDDATILHQNVPPNQLDFHANPNARAIQHQQPQKSYTNSNAVSSPSRPQESTVGPIQQQYQKPNLDAIANAGNQPQQKKVPTYYISGVPSRQQHDVPTNPNVGSVQSQQQQTNSSADQGIQSVSTQQQPMKSSEQPRSVLPLSQQNQQHSMQGRFLPPQPKHRKRHVVFRRALGLGEPASNVVRQVTASKDVAASATVTADAHDPSSHAASVAQLDANGSLQSSLAVTNNQTSESPGNPLNWHDRLNSAGANVGPTPKEDLPLYSSVFKLQYVSKKSDAWYGSASSTIPIKKRQVPVFTSPPKAGITQSTSPAMEERTEMDTQSAITAGGIAQVDPESTGPAKDQRRMGLRTTSIDSGIGQRSTTTTPESPRGTIIDGESDPSHEASTSTVVPRVESDFASPLEKAVLAISAGDKARCCVCQADASATCGACERACYCGEACQAAHWPTHVFECNLHFFNRT